jgi:PHS family inorganic phosphate transporter-like MFS transporter
MIPAEIFPTCYRCTCHGISAAAGKLGSLIVLIILYKVRSSNPNSNQLVYVFIIFGFVMAIGAVFAYAWTPDVQMRCDIAERSALQNRTLEDLGEGLGKESLQADQGGTLGFRNRWRSLKLRQRSNDD